MCRIVPLDKKIEVLETLQMELSKINLQVVCACTSFQEVAAFIKLNKVDILIAASDFAQDLKNDSSYKNENLKIINYSTTNKTISDSNESLQEQAESQDKQIEIIFKEIRLAYKMAVDKIQKRLPKVKLSQREIEVLKLIAFGYKIKEIASLLNISYYTAENHKKNLLVKMKVNNIASFVNIGHKLNYLN